MKIFLTGATGYVGAAIARVLVQRNHAVSALVRDRPGRRLDLPRTATVVNGDLTDLAACRSALAESDVVIHTGFDYGGSDALGASIDRGAARTIRAELEAAHRHDGRPRALLYTSNAYNLRTRGGAPVDETVDTAPFEQGIDPWRFELERELLAASHAGVRVASIRLGLVYGGLGGTLPDLFAVAALGLPVPYPGDGLARASVVHRSDVATLYALIAEQRADGVFHAVDGQPVTAIAIARQIAAAAGNGAARIEALVAGAPHPTLDPHNLEVLERDVAVVAPRSRGLGWRPAYPTFADGAAEAFDAWRAESGQARRRAAELGAERGGEVAV